MQLAAAADDSGKGPKLTDADVRQDTIFTIAAGEQLLHLPLTVSTE